MGVTAKAGKVCDLFIFCAIIVGTGFIIYTNIFHYCYKMNADIASEAVLAQLIWESGEWIPQSWYPSTELRICQTPNLAAFFYGAVKSMTLAMGMACVVMSLGILASGYYFISQCSFSRRQKLMFLLLCLVLPNHFVTLELLYLFGSYYAVHVIILFLTLGVYARMINRKRVGILWTVVLFMLSFLIGMQGVREIQILNLPLLVTEVLRQLYLVYEKTWNRESIKPMGWCTALLAAGAAGALLPFSIGQSMHRNVRNGLSKLFRTVLPDMKVCLGLTEIEAEGRILYVIFLLIAIAVCLCCIWQIIKKKCGNHDTWIYCMLWISVCITVFAVAFTTVESSQRYYFMLLLVMAFGFICFMRFVEEKSRILAGAGGVLLAALFVFHIYTVYVPIVQSKEPADSEEYAVCKYLMEHEFKMAYADFERANTMTVLSGGEIRVAAVASLERMDVCKWLSSTEWYVPNVPYQSRTAYIVTEGQRADFDQFYNLHREELRLEAQIGNFYIYSSEYNYSVLEESGD